MIAGMEIEATSTSSVISVISNNDDIKNISTNHSEDKNISTNHSEDKNDANLLINQHDSQNVSLLLQIHQLNSTCQSLVKKNEVLKKDVKTNQLNIDKLNKTLESLIENNELEQSRLKVGEKDVNEITDVKKIKDDTNIDDKIKNFNSNLEYVQLNLEQLKKSSEISLKSLHLYISQIDDKLEHLVRRHSLIVENLCPKEDVSAKEMFLISVNSILAVKIEETQIESIHLIELCGLNDSKKTEIGNIEKNAKNIPPIIKNNNKKPRPILVTFTCYEIRTKIYNAWLSYKSNISEAAMLFTERGQGLNIREYLTSKEELVFNEAVLLKEEKMVKDCWTNKGKCYVRNMDAEIIEFHRRNDIIPDETVKQSSCSLM